MSEENKKSGTLEHSKVFNLEKLVDYSEGAVVSRTLAKSEKGTVTLFSFDTGQALSEHSAPFDAMVQVLDGEVELIIGGEKIIAKTGEVVIMPKDIPHGVNANQRFKMLLTMIRG